MGRACFLFCCGFFLKVFMKVTWKRNKRLRSFDFITEAVLDYSKKLFVKSITGILM